MKNITKYLYLPLSFVFCAGAIAYGFDTEIVVIKSCSITAYARVKAHFSGSECIETEDRESCSSRFYSENASYIWEATTINNELHNANTDKISRGENGYFIAEMPKHDESISEEKFFDRFEEHQKHRINERVATSLHGVEYVKEDKYYMLQ